MFLALAAVFLLCTVKNLFADESDSTIPIDYYDDIIRPTNTSYKDLSDDDLRKLDVSCSPRDSCTEDMAGQKTCSCDSQCSMFGTCCIDSPYRKHFALTYQCRSEGVDRYFSDGYYMVYRCPNNIDANSVWKHLCEGKEKGDILKSVPVTSLDTNTTYTNYYCFRCHEITENFLYWKIGVHVKDTTEKIPDSIHFRVTYSEKNGEWVTTNTEEDISIPVYLSFSIPSKLPFKPISCNPEVISDCSDSWVDKYIEDKCRSYAAFVFSEYMPSAYKNVHCGLCNFESVNRLTCDPTVFADRAYDFRYLFDLNDFNENKERKIANCSDGHVWNPYLKTCKKIFCVVPGHVIKDGKCVSP